MAKLTQEQIMEALDALYGKMNTGLGKVSPPIEQLANDYLKKNPNLEDAAQSFIKYQIAKCTTSGFLTGLGGLITLPVAIPANISSVMYVQIRMIAGLAYMGGYDLNCDQVQTLVYACLAGISVDQVLKQTGVKIGMKLGTSLIKKIPGQTLTKINQKVGFRLVTKFGTKGLINLGKAIPVLGGVISGGFDFAETKIIAARAYNMFIKNDLAAFEAQIVSEEVAEEAIIEENPHA